MIFSLRGLVTTSLMSTSRLPRASPSGIFTASRRGRKHQGVATRSVSTSLFQRCSCGLLLRARLVRTFPCSSTIQYALDERWNPRKVPGNIRGPMLPCTSCPGPFGGGFQKTASAKEYILPPKSRPLARDHGVLPSVPLTTALRTKHVCSSSQLVRGCCEGTCCPSLSSRHSFNVRNCPRTFLTPTSVLPFAWLSYSILVSLLTPLRSGIWHFSSTRARLTSERRAFSLSDLRRSLACPNHAMSEQIKSTT